jgi:CheY-like chemotaxis protein/anti-sigma regulatory factor (Ser/Thr protein kinase)
VRQVQRLGKLVDNLLDVSRITAGKLVIEKERIDLAKVVRAVVSTFQQRTSGGLTVSTDTPVHGWWDPMRIEQIAENLVSNAIAYGAGRPIEVIVDGTPSRARVVVRDHGMGLTPADQARIFERFERIGTDSHRGGLGLGLWIVRQIVEAHDGTIRVESQAGAGATFTVELPVGSVDTVAAAPASPNAMGPGEQGAGSVLVVEDDRDTREGVSELLRRAGYTVACASNGQEALDYLRHAEPPAIILLDLMMPVMDGEHFLAARALSPALRPIPVVLLSASSDLEQRAKRLSVTSHMKKPIDVALLLAKVRELS